jgi:hypothetical protein
LQVAKLAFAIEHEINFRMHMHAARSAEKAAIDSRAHDKQTEALEILISIVHVIRMLCEREHVL